MAESETSREKRLRLKKAIISRAIHEGRGAQAIRTINALYRNRQATRQSSDDDIVGAWSAELSGGALRLTILDLAQADIEAQSRILKAFNLIAALSGSGRRLREACIVPGNTTIH